MGSPPAGIDIPERKVCKSLNCIPLFELLEDELGAVGWLGEVLFGAFGAFDLLADVLFPAEK